MACRSISTITMSHWLTFSALLFTVLMPTQLTCVTFSFELSYDGNYIKPTIGIQHTDETNAALMMATSLLVKDLNTILDQNPEKLRLQGYKKLQLKKQILTNEKIFFLKAKQSHEILKKFYDENDPEEIELEAIIKKMEQQYGF